MGTARGEHERTWHGFDAERALHWTRVLRMHWPTWPGAPELWRLTAELAQGRPVDIDEWADRARHAEAVGFTPSSYDALQQTLDAIPAVEHATHPDNAPDPRWPGHTIRAFDAETWRDWPLLVDLGWTAEEAALLLLTAGELPRPAR